MRRFACLIAVSLLFVSALSACSTRRGGRPRDGGPTVGDGGTVRFDSGGITLRDGGTPPGRDGGSSTGCVPACVPPATCSDGRCVPPSSTCRSMPIGPVTGVYCSAATQTCAMGCMDGECIFACLEADPSPDCAACATQNILACITAAGCQSEWDCFGSCIEDNCPSGSSETCPDTYCPSEQAAWQSCQASVGSSCGTEWVSCLPG